MTEHEELKILKAALRNPNSWLLDHGWQWDEIRLWCKGPYKGENTAYAIRREVRALSVNLEPTEPDAPRYDRVEAPDEEEAVDPIAEAVNDVLGTAYFWRNRSASDWSEYRRRREALDDAVDALKRAFASEEGNAHG